MTKEELLKVGKPILFNSEMVKAILEGKKTVTRRLIKPQPTYSPNDGFSWKGYAYGTDLPPTEKGAAYNFKCSAPYKPENILYVRETWCRGMIDSGEYPDGRSEWFISQCEGEDDLILKAHAIHEGIDIEDVIWKPSIHMPKEAARIFLKVKDVRVERLQDITEEQAAKEGCQASSYEYRGAVFGDEDTDEWTAVDEFVDIWNSTIKKSDIDMYGWDANPYVWVIEFERIILN